MGNIDTFFWANHNL